MTFDVMCMLIYLYSRGMLTLHCHQLLPTELLPIPPLCLSGKAWPVLSSIELPNDSTSPNSAQKLSVWPAFHNGAAAGLSLQNCEHIDSSWILYNKVALSVTLEFMAWIVKEVVRKFDSPTAPFV